ncbi:MAG: aldo/keto reductase [Betaproteobacteria bacterium]|nr:aldo/keto reductase [Betaproteobacteria bacterium]
MDEISGSRRRVLRLFAAAPALLAMTHSPASAAPRLTRPIAASGETLPVIGLGTWQSFGVGADTAARAPLREVLRIFAAAGGGMIDSSPMYGSSEAVAGDLIAEAGLRDRLFVATKVWTNGAAEGVRQMEESFRLLRVARMDLMQVHNLADVATHTRTLAGWKAQGRVRYLGVTHYSSYAYAEVERVLRAGNYDFLQINYSLAEREAEDRLLPLALDKGIAVIANRPFSQGAMFRRVRGKPLPPWVAELGIASWAQFFLKWLVGHPAITCAIPATGKPAHMADNLAAGRGTLTDAAMRRRMAAYYDEL